MEKCIPGNLVGHGKTQWEVRRPMALRRGKVRLKRAQVAYVARVARTLRFMHNTVDSTYIAICAIVRLLRIESLQRER
jgi:hypothetical protein